MAQEIHTLLSELRQKQELHLAALALFNPDQRNAAVVSKSGDAPSFHEIPVPAALEITVNQPHAIEVHDASSESRFSDLAQLMKAGGFHSFRIVPVSTQKYATGVLILGRNNSGGFAAEQVMLSDKAARQIALLLENSLVADLFLSDRARLKTLFDINTALASTFDIQEIFEKVSQTVGRIISRDYTCLAVYDKPADVLNIRFLDSENRPMSALSASAVPVSEYPAGIAHRQRAAMFFNHSDLQLFKSRYSQSLLAQGIRWLCHLPLISRNKSLGTLGLASLTGGAISEDDGVLLTQIASQMVLAVDNAHAHEEIARYQDRFSKEKRHWEDEISAQHNFGEVIGNSAVLCQALRQGEIAAPSDATGLILGETGTGKELIAAGGPPFELTPGGEFHQAELRRNSNRPARE